MKSPGPPCFDILWQPRGETKPAIQETSAGVTHTPIGMIRLTWSKEFLLGVEILPQDISARECPTARKFANHILSGNPPPLKALAKGTDFQLRVWQCLVRIPRGQTATYQEIASCIGSPNATRAVGTAIGANPLAILIPCHRVIRTDDSPGGYRWGLAAKLALLDAEQDVAVTMR